MRSTSTSPPPDDIGGINLGSAYDAYDTVLTVTRAVPA